MLCLQSFAVPALAVTIQRIMSSSVVMVAKRKVTGNWKDKNTTWQRKKDKGIDTDKVRMDHASDPVCCGGWLKRAPEVKKEGWRIPAGVDVITCGLH